MRRLALPLLLGLALAVPLAGCGSGDDDSASDTSGGSAAPAATTALGDASLLDGITVAGTFGEAPTLEFDKPFSTTETTRKVLSDGDGEAAGTGSTVRFDYVMVNATDGTEFDSSYARQPQSVVLDDPRLVPGFAKGLVGVQAGSRVLLALPPVDAFGDAGAPDAGVGPDDTVLSVVDVTEVLETVERAQGTPVPPVAGQPTVALDDDGKPTITLPDGPAPTQLVVQPLIEGTGPVVEAGQTLKAHYTGIIWPGGKQFDSSWDRGEPSEFPIGVGRVIPGWDEGLVGKTVGSQVLLVIPPDKGYGPQGNASGGIAGTDTLVFVVDILAAA